ncbi:hypothetical protein AJ88_19260 [Mesorhizobium amorphae CCBAU 01583]|nr:hypothetical protein AJ88_19260 [Mesorhizobium amorphae CCBAU 01583]
MNIGYRAAAHKLNAIRASAIDQFVSCAVRVAVSRFVFPCGKSDPLHIEMGENCLRLFSGQPLDSASFIVADPLNNLAIYGFMLRAANPQAARLMKSAWEVL